MSPRLYNRLDTTLRRFLTAIWKDKLIFKPLVTCVCVRVCLLKTLQLIKITVSPWNSFTFHTKHAQSKCKLVVSNTHGHNQEILCQNTMVCGWCWCFLASLKHILKFEAVLILFQSGHLRSQLLLHFWGNHCNSSYPLIILDLLRVVGQKWTNGGLMVIYLGKKSKITLNKQKKSGWWLNQPSWKILVKLGIFPKVRGEHKKYLKAPPRNGSGNRGLRHGWSFYQATSCPSIFRTRSCGCPWPRIPRNWKYHPNTPPLTTKETAPKRNGYLATV